jgi:hypothetical protein
MTNMMMTTPRMTMTMMMKEGVTSPPPNLGKWALTTMQQGVQASHGDGSGGWLPSLLLYIYGTKRKRKEGRERG